MVKSRRDRSWIFLVSTSATSIVFLDNTVMPVALPTIGRDLGFTGVGLVWIVNSYLLTLIAFLLIGGKLYDVLGMRRTYILGLSFFGIGSILGGLSYTKAFLITARVVQGGSGALLVPTTGALLISTFPPQERARAIGINTGISSIFMILGPAISGFLTQYLSWRYIFWINLPIIVFGIIMSRILLPKGDHKKEHFHIIGALTSTSALVCLVVALMQGSDWGWSSPVILILFGGSAVFLALFIYLSLGHHTPLLDFEIIKNRLFRGANLTIFLTQFLLMVTILWAIYFQEQLGFSQVKTGLLILVAVTPVILIAPLAGYLTDRFEPRLPILFGFACITFGLVWLAFFSTEPTISPLLPGLLPFGGGVAMILSPSFATALGQAKPATLGSAAGMTTITRQLASTLGIAVMSAIFQGVYRVTHSYMEAFKTISLIAAGLSVCGFLLASIVLRK